MDSYISQEYLHISEYKKPKWNWNLTLQFPLPSHYQLNHPHIQTYIMLFPSGHSSSCWPGWTLLNIGNHMRNSISPWYGCKPSKLSKKGLRPNVTKFCKQHFVFINIKQLFVDTKYAHRNRCYYHRRKYLLSKI